MLGSKVTDINFFATDLLLPNATQITVNIDAMLKTLSGIAKALLALAKNEKKQWKELLATAIPNALQQTIAMRLANASNATLFVGDLANNHPHASKIRSLTKLISTLTNSQLIILPTANSTAADITKQLLANDGHSKDKANQSALNAKQVWQKNLRSYVLFGVEPELDCVNPVAVEKSLQQASFVVSINSFVTDNILSTADVILPLATFAESSGTFVGVDGQWQSYSGAINAKADSRPGWKILRVLGNLANLKGFDYVSSPDVRDEVQDQLNLQSASTKSPYIPESLSIKNTLTTISEVPMYQTDAIVRRSEALQKTPENQRAYIARMNSAEAEKQGLTGAKNIIVDHADNQIEMPFEIDDAIADACIYIAAGIIETAMLGAAFSEVQVQAIESLEHVGVSQS